VPSFADVPGGTSTPLLPGDPQELVSAVSFDLSEAPAWTDAEIEVDPSSGARVLRTSLGIFFTDDATVGAANALLARIRATIVAMLAGPPYVVVRIPDPGSLDALQAIIADVAADPAVASVSRDVIPEATILPPDFPRPEGDLSQQAGLGYIDHLLQARVAQAWNARGAVKQAPVLVMADNFGAGVPGVGIDAEYPVSGDFAVGRPDPVIHGYQVLGVIAADWSAEGGPANCLTTPPGADSLRCATGVYPGPILPRVRAVDARRHSWLPMEVKILEAVEALNPALPVVNVSLYTPDTVGQKDTTAKTAGDRWIRLVRERKGGSLESNFLLVTAAGNVEDKPNAVRDALTNSAFTAAALHPDLPRLSNIIVVENSLDGLFPFRPLFPNRFSKEGGHISACGTYVWTLVQNPLNPEGGWDGTSLSSPLVAGVAAYAWSIAPELSVNQIKDLLIRNAQPQDQVPGAPPALDAYASIVDIDNVTDGNNDGEFPVRRALLDFISVGGEVLFNSEDVLNFFLFRNDREPEDRRYRKEDLRAAFAPQTDSVRFDLDASGTFETFSVDTGSHRVQYDEERVATDADIVCHSAFASRGAYERSTDRIDPGRDRCCRHYKDIGRLPPDAVCVDECPARGRARGLALEDEPPQPLGVWRLSVPSGLVVYEFSFLEDGTVMMPWLSGRWKKNGTWTSTPREENGEIFYDVRIDACTGTVPHLRYAFEGTWSPRPLTDCFGVTSCFNGDDCPAMKGALTTSDGITTTLPGAVDSKRVEGIDGWAPLADPLLNQCHGECFDEWWRSGLLACAPLGGHCLETSAPTCGGVCLPGSTCVDAGGSCTCVAVEEP
jgi:hypothetical protein